MHDNKMYVYLQINFKLKKIYNLRSEGVKVRA